MTEFKMRQSDMPYEMQMLLREYPRDIWAAHPGFQSKTEAWMNAHQGFRQLSAIVRVDVENFLDHHRDGVEFSRRLSRYGGRLIGNLHGHHGWEDYEYFPELAAADPRFQAGLDLLEQDHAQLDIVLDAFTKHANRSIQLIQLDAKEAKNEAGRLFTAAQAIERFLERHLSDEEELAVPIILHHRLRG